MHLSWAKIDSFVGNSSAPTLKVHCGSIRSRVLLELTDFQFYTDSAECPKRMSVRENQCLECLALYLNPCYSDYGFRILFAEAGQSYGSTDAHAAEQIGWLKTRGLLDTGRRVLDAGCYDGRFLAKMPHDVIRTGVDIDEPAITLGKTKEGPEGIEFILGNFETFRCEIPPDVITMFHVLEHLPKPREVLGNLRSFSHQKTQLVLEVPILENGGSNDINGFFSVQHMTHFSRRSLNNIMSTAGWKVTEWCEQPDYNGYRVLAEPCGETSPIKGDGRDTVSLHRYLYGWYQALVEVDCRLSDIQLHDRCVVWGGGAHTEFLYHTTSLFQANPEREYAIVDSDPLKQGKTWRGITIHGPHLLKKVDWANVCLIVSSYGSQEAIVNAARDLGVPPERIVHLYDEPRVY